jgi:hypothetical protein
MPLINVLFTDQLQDTLKKRIIVQKEFLWRDAAGVVESYHFIDGRIDFYLYTRMENIISFAVIGALFYFLILSAI